MAVVSQRSMPDVQAPSSRQLTKAKEAIRRYTAKDLGVTTVEKRLKGFIVNDASMMALLKAATSMSTVDRNAVEKLKDQLGLLPFTEISGDDDMIEVKSAGEEVSAVKIVAISNKSETSANPDARDIAIRFAVIKFKRSEPWYSRFAGLFTGGPSIDEENEFEDALKVLCMSELAKMQM